MKSKSDRRVFLKNIGVGSAAALLPVGSLSFAEAKPVDADKTVSPAPSPGKRKYNSEYTGQHLNRVAFPIGGLGAGMFCMEGSGAISHMSVKNKPEIFNEPGMFAAICVRGVKNGAKLLEGPVPDWKKFGLRDAANGLGGSTTGLPHFHDASFKARFPFAYLDITDNDLPLKVQVTGWSPFIPTDDDNSSLPVGAMEYKFTNTGKTEAEAVFSFNTKNFLGFYKGQDKITAIKNGFVMTQLGTKEKPMRSDFAIFTDEDDAVIDHCWFRGGWWDPVTMAWNEVKSGNVKANPPVESDAPGATLYVPFKLMPGKEKVIKVMMAWYTPDSELTFGEMGTRKENCDPASGCCNSPGDIGLDKYDKDFNGKFYKPWYSSRFATVEEVADYWLKNYIDLKKKSTLFKDAFFSSTLPPEVMEAVAANLSILKSPTVMRQYDGRLWSYEGCADDNGCCHGSCTPVWNYAQAIPHLFPALERSLRHTEFCESQDVSGHQTFRANLPIQPTKHDFHAAADGQLGGIMKVYREWRIYGDNVWLKKMYPMVKTSMDYCITTWDPRHRGAIEEPHHNTYDIEFWGGDGMHTSFYCGALNAITAMGKHLNQDVTKYEDLAKKAKNLLETELYDGEYFIQEIKYKDLNAKNPATAKSFGGEYSKEAQALMEKEGPKYQYGKGCLSDGILGAWIGRMCGVPETIDPKKIKSHLLAVHKYNLKENLSEHANPQRPTYALGDEGGLLLCTWPKGGKLSLPFVYSDEVWTGIEHQVASHLMLMGNVKEGLEVVRAARDRYDGKIRNPFNEYECGSWYARALSSYGYLQALTGVRYDAVDKTLHIDSKIGDFTSFLSTETGFGTVSLHQGKPVVKVVYGKIDIGKTLVLGKQV
ncbi:GH116 family glycosyl hydrolase [Mucilaginibacter sp.]|uniref:GH116 family glycosyl hydrolase n=1 Tax=Mucilaginibacter sp. TaxID=1882438 RepID=UPI0025E2C927|nr:GH116 family glycosyl hydrolase [Mucilaginibacter sp.]